MASRCINTLNDLDRISERICRKHSKIRFRASIEAKLKAAKEKAERSFQESCKEFACVDGKSTRTSSTDAPARCFSTTVPFSSGPGSVRSIVSNQRKQKNEGVPKSHTAPTKGAFQRKVIQRKKTNSCPSFSASSKSEEKSKTSDSDATRTIPPSVSIFGKHSNVEAHNGAASWFNLPHGTDMGTINSVACKGEKPVYHSVNIKKGKTEPHVLKHNMEVRVGQNGVVKVESKRGTAMSEYFLAFGEDERGNNKGGKTRTAPLSWEEQLNWKNAQLVSSAPSSIEIPLSKSLCETRPVIFHSAKSEQETELTRTRSDVASTAAFKISLQTRWVYPDRRNLVSTTDKVLTAVELEDFRTEGDLSSETRNKSNRGDNRSDINGVEVKHIEPSYPEFGSNKRKHMAVIDKGKRHVANLAESLQEKPGKKVSFEDEAATQRSGAEVIRSQKTEEQEAFSEVTIDKSTTEDKEKSVIFENLKERPKTGSEISRKSLVLNDESSSSAQKLRRPHTAPPSSTRTRDANATTNELIKCAPIIKIPTSRRDVESPNEESTSGIDMIEIRSPKLRLSPEQETTTVVSADISDVSPGTTPEKNIADDFIDSRQRDPLSVSKSAPILRSVARRDDAHNPPRAKSSTALRRPTYTPPLPVVVVSEASVELPQDLPPAQALIALRKKIREDLAQQNHELQLDIQQLYLNKHSENFE